MVQRHVPDDYEPRDGQFCDWKPKENKSKEKITLSDGRTIHEDDYFELSVNTSEDYWYLIYDNQVGDMVDRYCSKEDYDKLQAFINDPKRKRININGESWNAE